MSSQNDLQSNRTALKQYNVQLPTGLVDELKGEAHRLTGHRRRGFSDLLAICAQHGWEAYQRGELAIDRQAKVVTYQLVRSKS